MEKQAPKKMPLNEIAEGKIAKEGEQHFETKSGKKCAYVHIWGNILKKYESKEKNFSSVLLDDFTATLNASAFERGFFKKFSEGDRIEVIGKPKENRNNEIYIHAEIAKKIDSYTELMRRLENVKGIKKEELKIEKHNV